MTLASEQAEQALVGRLLLEPKQLALVAGLRPEDFGVDAYGDIFRGMLQLQDAGKPIDLVTLRTVVEGEIDIDPLELTAGHRGPVDEYAGIIKLAAARRRTLVELDYVRDLAASGEGDLIGALEKAISKILEGTDSDVTTPMDAAKAYTASLIERTQGRDPGLPWGIPGMDDLVLPARRGRLSLLAARPSVGKTAMAETIADTWAQRGPVLFVTLEMDKEELLDRGAARDTGVSGEAISLGRLNPEQLEAVLNAVSARANGNIHYMDTPSATVDRIRAASAKMKMQHGLVGIIIDYTQLIEAKGHDGNDNSKISAISRALKVLARAMQVPVLAMSQLNRAIDRERRNPRLSDLRDSGALEQDADVVMFLTGQPDESERVVHVLKQRQGKVGKFHVQFDGDHLRWREPAPWSLPVDTSERENPRELAKPEAELTW